MTHTGHSITHTLYRFYRLIPWLNPRVQFLQYAAYAGAWLDIGSGNGYVTRHLHNTRPDLNLTATDVNDYDHDYKKHDIPFVRLKGYPWPFMDNSFDIITSFHVIEHVAIKERDQFFSELTRVLRREGIFYIETPSKRSLCLPKIKSQHGITNFWQDPTHVQLVSEKEFRDATLRYGWEDLHIRISRNRLFVLLAPLLLPLALFPPGNLAYHYTVTNLIGWSIQCTGKKGDL